MAKLRQQYRGDWSYVDKQKRDFTLTQTVINKLQMIDAGAEANIINTIKVNWTTIQPDENKIVNIKVPVVNDTLTSSDPSQALSARQWKLLYDYIKNFQTVGRYLSNWNASIGAPTSNPSHSPYTYMAWDYYIVSIVNSWTNYRPSWAVYVNNTVSTVVETEDIKINDVYVYDGAEWLLLVNTERDMAIDSSLSLTSQNAVENRVVTAVLNSKANDADISTVGKSNNYDDLDNKPTIPSALSQLTGTADDLFEWEEHLFLTLAERAKLALITWTNTGDETIETIKEKLWIASADRDGYLTKEDWAVFNAKSDFDWAYESLTNKPTIGDATLTIKKNGSKIWEFLANQTEDGEINVEVPTTVGELTDASDYYNKTNDDADDIIEWETHKFVTLAEKAVWSWKQDTIEDLDEIRSNASAGKNASDSVANMGDIVSHNASEFATAAQWSKADTALQSGDNVSELTNDAGYITADYHDNTKQDVLEAGANIQINWNVISATDTTYTAWDGISIEDGVISNTNLSAEWWNIAGDITDQSDLQTALSAKANSADLATVATSWSYDDLINKPAQAQSDWAQTDADAVDYIKNKPTIPVVNDNKLTIKQWWETKWEFTANSNTDKEVNLNTFFIKTQSEYEGIAEATSDWNIYLIYNNN